MRVCLVTAPTISDFGDPEITLDAYKPRGPQLGVLTVAAAIRASGHEPIVVDLDRVAIDTLREGREDVLPDDLFQAFVSAVTAVDAAVFGFSTICGSYPLTIRLARETAHHHSETPIVFGGPQASVVDIPTLTAFPWIDLIVRGEADQTFPAVLDALACARLDELDFERLPGVTFRTGGTVRRSPAAQLVADLDVLPLPAFDLDPHIQTRRSAHLELGRGCPYGCTFCSTNDFFRRRFRLKSAERMLAQMRELNDRYGVIAFTLVHDMYTVDRRRVVEFCELLLASGEQFEWSCSARTDRVDRDLLTLMAEAGCRGIFFGIETGSVELQRDIKKRLDLDQAWQSIVAATDNGMKTAVALIAGFPNETRDDLRDTVHFYVRSTRLDHAEPQMSLLAPLAETPIEKAYRGRLLFDHIYSDMSYQGWREDPKDFELIEKHPDIFPNFYSVPTLLPRPYVRELHDFVLGITLWFRWLPIALLDTTEDFLAVFDMWAEWHDSAQNRGELPDLKRDVRYYCTNIFADHLLMFVREALDTALLPGAAILENAWQYESTLAHLSCAATSDSVDTGTVRASTNARLTLSANVSVHSLRFDPTMMLDELRGQRPASDVGAQGESVIAVLAFADKPAAVLRLPKAATELLALCDGEATVAEIVQRYSESTPRPIPHGRSAALLGLTSLYEDGILDVADEPLPATVD